MNITDYLPGIFDEYVPRDVKWTPRGHKVNHRPYTMLTTERITVNDQTAIDLLPGSKLRTQKQLGEISYIYGMMINRIEGYINERMFDIDGTSLVISAPYAEFTDGFTSKDKDNLIKYRDSFSRAVLYRWKDKAKKKMISEELPFFETYLTREHEPDKRILNIGKPGGKARDGRPIWLNVRINSAVYEAVIQYMGKKLGSKQQRQLGGVVPITRDSIDVIRFWIRRTPEYDHFVDWSDRFGDRFGMDKDRAYQVMRKIRYRDQLRVAYERIEEYIHRAKILSKPVGSLWSMTDIYKIIFPSKHSGDGARFFALCQVFDFTWAATHKERELIMLNDTHKTLTILRTDPKEMREKFRAIMSK